MTRSDGIAALLIGFSAGLTLCIMLFFVFLLLSPGISTNDILKAYHQGQSDSLKTNPPSEALERVCAGLWMDRQPTRP